jgi:hypothetical protein
MTDVRIGGLGREALVSEVGEVRLGGLAREALHSGLGLYGRLESRSYGSAEASISGAPVLTTVGQYAVSVIG